MEAIKQETIEEICEVKIENNGLDDALLDSFKCEIKEEDDSFKCEVKEESNLESTDDIFDCSAVKEFPIKTELEQDGNKLISFKGKRKIKEDVYPVELGQLHTIELEEIAEAGTSQQTSARNKEEQTSKRRLVSSNIKDACEVWVRSLTVLVEEMKAIRQEVAKAAIINKGKVKLEYFRIFQTFDGFEDFWDNL
uniref:Uncharacterized protein LOC114345666 n=1 Tax=Diabrotica virgifera virgifera TaxID=50390 RepID=A0A6P7H8L3_DIAVI